MDIFESSISEKSRPLAYRMRPRTLDEYIGQDHIVGHGRLLRRAIQADRLSSVIFYGPPGTGKTTLARVIANTTKSYFTSLNAVLSGVKELRDEIEKAKNLLSQFGKKTILFIDEVHRWNKSQQDALLPWVENGTIILIGATTQNPFFEVNPALVSRSRIFQLKSLTDNDLNKIAIQAIKDKERGYGNLDITFEKGALEHLIDVSSGDARTLLNALELAVETTERTEDNKVFISMETAEESIQKKAVLYDKEGDYHFDIISAFIKSLRGSDPDAALYWLSKMIYAGEDPHFIFRRMLISACEDIGLADPNAIVVVQADASAFDTIGLPEGRYHLAHAALYLSTAEKSNSTMGFFDALKAVETEAQNSDVPNHLRDASRDSEGFSHGKGYLYPHSYNEHWVAQQYLPSTLQGKIFYQPGNLGYEKKISEKVLRHREIQLESITIDAFPENLTFSPEDKIFSQWINRAKAETSKALSEIRDIIFSNLSIKRSDRILVLNAGHGLLLWEALRLTPEGYVCGIANNSEDYSYILHYSKHINYDRAPFLITKISELPENIKYEFVLGRNIFTFMNEEEINQYINNIKKYCISENVFSFSETNLKESSHLSDFIISKNIKQALINAEKKIYKNINIQNEISKAFTIDKVKKHVFNQDRIITESDLKRWWDSSYSKNIDKNDKEIYKSILDELANTTVKWKTSTEIIFFH